MVEQFATTPEGLRVSTADLPNIVAGVDLNGTRAQEMRLSRQEATAVLEAKLAAYRAGEAAERAAATAAAEREGVAAKAIAAAGPKIDSGAARARLEAL
jgi:hypothetical protein